VFDMAMRATRRWVDDGLRFGRLAVNLSPQHLSNGALLRDFCSAMAAHGVAPNLLAVELLESFLLDDRQSNIQETLNALRDSGVSVELDDFGTGYASLAHLSTMPITGIKVDRSFICGINDDPKRMNIVSSLISMSKLMGLRVVCEGVETADHVAAIKQVADCTVQGYYIARPMPFAAATAWIREGRNIGLLTRHGAALTRSA